MLHPPLHHLMNTALVTFQPISLCTRLMTSVKTSFFSAVTRTRRVHPQFAIVYRIPTQVLDTEIHNITDLYCKHIPLSLCIFFSYLNPRHVIICSHLYSGMSRLGTQVRGPVAFSLHHTFWLFSSWQSSLLSTVRNKKS